MTTPNPKENAPADLTLKYSSSPSLVVINFLVINGINFICRKGIQSLRRRVFFVTDPDTAQTLMKTTGSNLSDEMDGWDFDNWEALKRN